MRGCPNEHHYVCEIDGNLPPEELYYISQTKHVDSVHPDLTYIVRLKTLFELVKNDTGPRPVLSIKWLMLST